MDGPYVVKQQQVKHETVTGKRSTSNKITLIDTAEGYDDILFGGLVNYRFKGLCYLRSSRNGRWIVLGCQMKLDMRRGIGNVANRNDAESTRENKRGGQNGGREVLYGHRGG